MKRFFLYFFVFYSLKLEAQIRIIRPYGGISFPNEVLKVEWSHGDYLMEINLKIFTNSEILVDTSIKDKNYFIYQVPSYLENLNLKISNQFESDSLSLMILQDSLVEYSFITNKVKHNFNGLPRDGAGGLYFKNKLWILGGWNGLQSNGLKTNSEIYSSSDGENWVFHGLAPWKGRHTAGWLIHNDSIYILGGDNISGEYQMDVWKSGDGLNWYQIIDSIPISKRVLFNYASYRGKLFLIFGEQVPWNASFNKNEDSLFSEIWSSQNGKDWELESSEIPFIPRAMQIGNSSMKNYIWILGGGTYQPRNYNSSFLPRSYYNDLYRTNDLKN